MYHKVSSPEPPSQLLEYIDSSTDSGTVSYLRRAILTKTDNGSWQLLCCSVEALSSYDDRITDRGTRSYAKAILYEDRLTKADCLKFIQEIQNGEVSFGEILLSRRQGPQWQTQIVPLKNYYMKRAGLVVDSPFYEGVVEATQEPLFAPDAPYYPDSTEAARDWLPFPIYNGVNDARNGRVAFLLPEARAYFTGASFSEGIINVRVGGHAIMKSRYLVKGAYWKTGSMTHFESDVIDGVAAVAVPENVERLDYLLIDSGGKFYDFQTQDRYSNSGLSTMDPTSIENDLIQTILTVCLNGEGAQIEFKPFVYVKEKVGENKRDGKLLEILKTIVSFANTRGGRVYIGINDDCSIAGVRDGIRKWSEAEVTDAILDRYCGILTNWIRGQVVGDFHARLSHVRIDDEYVIMAEIAEAQKKPIEISNDRHLYVRSGANNRPLPPNQWVHVIGRTDALQLRWPDFGE
jgi:hypothetical protein